MSNLRIISWNILNDGKVPKHPPQKDRLEGVADQITNYLTKQPTIIFLFEVVDSGSFKLIAEKIGYKNYGSTKYNPELHMGYISNVPINKMISIDHNPGKLLNKNNQSMRVHYNEVSIDAVHMPFHPLFHIPIRLSFITKILESEKQYKKRIIAGDLNSFILMPTRLLLWVVGFRNVFASSSKADKFPSPEYRGITYPKYFPKASIDAHYTKHVRQSHHYRENTAVSDHPILVSDFVI